MLQPLGKRVLIKPIAPEKKNSVLILKEEIPQTFLVVGVGDDVTKVQVNDKVFVGSYSTSEIKFEGETSTLVQEENIIAKVI